MILKWISGESFSVFCIYFALAACFVCVASFKFIHKLTETEKVTILISSCFDDAMRHKRCTLLLSSSASHFMPFIISLLDDDGTRCDEIINMRMEEYKKKTITRREEWKQRAGIQHGLRLFLLHFVDSLNA